MAKDRPETIEELCNYIEIYQDSIFVREQSPSGAWVNLSLSELTTKQAIHHVCKFIAMGIIPVRVVSGKKGILSIINDQ